MEVRTRSKSNTNKDALMVFSDGKNNPVGPGQATK